MNNKNEGDSFLSRENVEMIWELIADEDIVRNVNGQEMVNMQKLFLNDIRQFYQRENGSSKDLMNMNKQFIEIMLQKMAKPTINKPLEASVKMAITAEDIQTSRMNEFEKQFAERQNEFSRAMTLKVPEKPEFGDEIDKPIGEMEDLIARTLAQRNFDIEQIQQNINKEQVKTFLQSQETSIKNEKLETQKTMQQIITPRQQEQPMYNVDKNEVKYIQIGQEELPQLNEVIDLQRTVNERRQVSWADEENIKLTMGGEQEEKPSIFSKLKMKSRENGGGSLSPFESYLETGLKTTTNFNEEFKTLSRKVDDLNSKVDAIFEFIKKSNKIKIDETLI
jgi:hypothetical protein